MKYLSAALILFCLFAPLSAGEQKLTPSKGDHITLIGNALAERMQHDGYLETALHARFPELDLVIRNLGYSADELTIRNRVEGFSDANLGQKGAPGGILEAQNRWLARCQTDVVFAFFGFNESFAGAAGLPKFKNDLAAHIKNLQAQNFNGKGAPKLVYFSPIAYENSASRPLLPDGKEDNARLELYTNAMKEVCAANQVPFVDLYNYTISAYGGTNWTINGVHLNDGGNGAIAAAIHADLFGNREIKWRPLEKLRQAVLDKNFYWYNRYRPTDDYNIFGGRSTLTYENGPGKNLISNYQVLIREMEVLEVLAANRDKKIWAAARGQDFTVDDSTTPPFIEVKTNRAGKKPDGSYDFLSGEEAIAKMKPGKNLKINLFASEEKFPELANPVQMAFDTKGRLWVAAWPTYPHWKPKTPMNDKLVILEDTDGDGRADKCTTFAGDLHDPCGFEFWNGGVIVSQAPDLMFLKDTNGDDKADVRERLLHGLSSGDTHHTANSFVIDPGGGLYWGEGVFHRSTIESIYGPVRNIDACIWRFDLRTWRVERYIPHNFANPHGNVVDYWGQQFVHDGTGANPYHATLFSGHLDFPAQHPSPPQLYRQTTRPLPATEILSSKHFPEEYQGNLLVADVINTQGILRYKIAPDGASFQATALEPIVVRGTPGDANFRPADVEMGPDGAIYFLDWHKPLIGHMQHHLRDPNRDQVHGRVYRITYEGRPLDTPAKIAGEPIEKVLDLLKDSGDRVRSRARLELSARPGAQVVAAAQKWAVALDKNDPAYEHHMMEALWLHQANGVVNMELLQRMLRSPEPNARAAATRVLSVQRELVKEPLYLLRTQSEDEHPLVRLEAVRACSFFRTAEAAEVALLSLKKPSDRYLNYTLAETMRQLKPYWSAALARGESITKNNPAAANYVLDQVPTANLLKLERTEAIYAALLARHDASEQDRLEAVNALAKQYNSNPTVELLNAMDRADKADGAHSAHIVGDLARLLLARTTKELSDEREKIRQHSVRGKTGELRAAAYAAWMTGDGSEEAAYAEASKTKDRLTDFLNAVPYVKDAKVQTALYARVRPLMFDLPEHLKEAAPARPVSAGLQVKVYQFNPQGAALEKFSNKKPDATATVDKIIVTLPQVKDPHVVGLIFSGNLYVAKAGKHTFYLSSDDGSCMYLDGKKIIDNDGLHGMSEKSATLEVSGGAHPITITYWNNSGGYGLDAAWSGPDFGRKPLAGDISGGLASSGVQDAAIRALAALPGRDAERFADFAKLIGDPARRAAAVTALRSVPKNAWPADQAPRIVDTILAYLTSLPASDRTSAAAVDALNLGKDLAALLPAEKSTPLQARLKTLNVEVVVIRPVHHMMLFDHKRFYVEAGKPVEVIFDNTDVMPHNLVFVKPGALTEVGLAAEALGPAGAAKDSIPDSDKILWHTKLMLPGTQQRLTFTAPAELGEYPYICTFPGHYLVMNGVMEVVKEKSAAHAPEIVTLHQDGPQRPFVKMWEMKDLEAEFAQPLQGRNAARGKEMFTAAGCMRCHAVKGEGKKIGPDLADIAKKYKGKELLKQIIEPSAVIDEPFRNWQVALKDGRRITGMIVKKDDTTVEFNTNPLAADGIVKVPAGDIQKQVVSPLSPMPTGMLVTLNKDEILDLVDWLEKAAGK